MLQVSNKQIAQVLNEIAEYLEAQRVQFKPRAYQKAAQVIESLSEPLSALYKKCGTKCLDDLPGIGQSIAEKIEELLKTGRLKYLAELKKKMPVNIADISRIEGIGPKMALELYKKLGIKTLTQLEAAAKSGKVARLKGYGKKSEEKILKGIEFLKTERGRILLGDAMPIASAMIASLKTASKVKRCEAVGSIRRKRETIGDIDIVCSSNEPKKVLNAFVKLPNVKSIIEKGERDASVRLKDGVDADIIVIPENDFGSAMVHFTGSKYHNIQLRQIAQKRGMKLNEYGLFRGIKKIAAKTETDVYRALGLPYIEPELREANGEIEAARGGKLPKLIAYGSIRGDLQVQTNWTDGDSSIEEMARAARVRGLDYFAITDHTRTLAMTGGLDEKKLSAQGREIDKLNKKLKGFRILKSAEVNILKDGKLDIADWALKKLDVVSVAVHSNFAMNERDMTERIIRAIKHPLVNILFHPTGRLINKRPAYALNIERIIRAAKQYKVALEANASPERLDLNAEHIRAAIKAGVKLVVNSDAHHPDHFDFLDLGVSQCRRGWARATDVLNTKTVDAFLKAIEK
ncbi:TPA: DNA polymerase/3'-5' exonuclease PolX [Candidatus Uhrbacteria bacterium]|nr:DNA polymerase/3'-5' exonuclease PolX [Candidatus Uhrbacteria bacterium]